MVGLLNVVTGIFVDSAVCTRTEDEAGRPGQHIRNSSACQPRLMV